MDKNPEVATRKTFRRAAAIVVAGATAFLGTSLYPVVTVQAANSVMGAWAAPDGAKAVGDARFISGGLSYYGTGGDPEAEANSFQLAISYRAVLDPNYDWIYLRLDPRIASHVTKMTALAMRDGASPVAQYLRIGEKVGPETPSNINILAQVTQAKDPYGDQDNVWRFLNSRKSATGSAILKKNQGIATYRGLLDGNWGIFTDLPLQNYKMWAKVVVTLDKPLTEIISETGSHTFDADIRWQRNGTDGTKFEYERSVNTGAAIDFEQFFPKETSTNTNWPTSNAYSTVLGGYGAPIMSTISSKNEKAPNDTSVIRTILSFPPGITSYNSSVGIT